MESALFRPLQIGSLTLHNRVVVSPMCQYSAIDGSASSWHYQHLGQLACSRAGLIMVEATAVQREGRITHGCLGLYSESNEKALSDVIQFAKKFSGPSLFGIQLAHAGRKASAELPWEGRGPLGPNANPWKTVAPSPIPYADGWHVPHELTIQEMRKIIDDFVEAAKKAVRIGFDVIELHAAHGYLLHQFLSPISNKRKDEYGGSLENRMRFALQIAEAVKKVIPPHSVLGARITGTDWDENGIQIEDAVQFAKMLKTKGVLYVCVSSGGLISHLNIPVGPLYQLPLAARVKEGSGIITRTVGMIKTPEEAERAMSGQKADFVALARAFLDDPRWVWHAADTLRVTLDCPPQYFLARPPRWTSPVVTFQQDVQIN